MSKLLIRLFIKDYKNTEENQVRSKYGKLASAFGIFTNVLISIFKLVFGLLFGLISLIGDGLNNLSDAANSIISLVGFRLSAKPADKDHPFGHARIEYITGLIVSIVVVILGIQLIITSVKDIIAVYQNGFELIGQKEFIISVIVLGIAILAKIYQCFFYKKIAKTIHSVALEANAVDSRNDVLATSVVAIGLILSYCFKFYIDGYLGICVGLFIIYSGINLIKETADPLIGENPNNEIVHKLIQFVKESEGVLGIHDLQFHAYGPGKYFATMHVEVDASIDILITHDLIDNIEKSCFEQFNILTTMHMDPVVLNDPFTTEVHDQLYPLLKANPNITNVHDFRIVKGPTHVNIVFDAIKNTSCTLSDDEVKKQLSDIIIQYNASFNPIITIDQDYATFIED